MTTTARALAEEKKPIHPCEPWFDENWNKLLLDESKTWFDITCAIWEAAETRGRESVLSRVPSAGLLDHYFEEANEEDCSTGNGLWNCFHKILLAKLKEPT